MMPIFKVRRLHNLEIMKIKLINPKFNKSWNHELEQKFVADYIVQLFYMLSN